jgi:hypothetical protein
MLLRPRLVLVTLLACTVFACGPNARQQVVNSTFAALQATRAGFEAYNLEHQTQIIHDQSLTKEQQDQAIEAYRKAREPVLAAMLAAYAALMVAASSSTAEAMTNALQAAQYLYQEILKFTGQPAASRPTVRPPTSQPTAAPAGAHP